MTFHERTHVRHFVATFVRALTVFVVLPIVGRGLRARVSLFRGFTHRMLRISSTHETPWLASRTSKGLWNLALETRDLQHESTHEFLIFIKLTTMYIYILNWTKNNKTINLRFSFISKRRNTSSKKDRFIANTALYALHTRNKILINESLSTT